MRRILTLLKTKCDASLAPIASVQAFPLAGALSADGRSETLSSDEGEEVFVEPFPLRNEQVRRRAGIDLKGRALDEL
jgi:hypothetical protein